MKKKALMMVKEEEGIAALLSSAKEHYSSLQRSWFDFAKTIHAIHAGKDLLTDAGYDSFKQYVEREFPQVPYVTIVKFVKIVDSWGKSIDSKIEKDPEFILPAYDSCYRVIVAEKKPDIPKEEISWLKKKVLGGEISFLSLYDKLKELSGTASDLKEDDADKDFKAAEAMVEDEDVDGDDVADSEDEAELPPITHSEPDPDPADFDAAISAAMVRVGWLNDNLPELRNYILSFDDPNDEIQNLLSGVEKLNDNCLAILKAFR